MKTEQQQKEPLASFEALVWIKTGKLSGEYQLKVGDLCISSPPHSKNEAEKWLPVIVDSVNAMAGVADPTNALAAAREALEKIADIPAVPFCRDRVEHASRTIEAMQEIARVALEKL